MFLCRTYLQPPSSAAIFQFYEMDKLVQNFNPSISRDSFNFNLHTPIGQNLLYDGAFINTVCTFLCHLFVNLMSWLEYNSAVIYSKALRCTFLGEWKNSCSSNSCNFCYLIGWKARWSKNRAAQGFYYINSFSSNIFGPNSKTCTCKVRAAWGRVSQGLTVVYKH